MKRNLTEAVYQYPITSTDTAYQISNIQLHN